MQRQTVKLLILFDIGGSMDAHVKVCEELFSACKTEFKHMEYYYFHNFIYESVWKNNLRRGSERTSTQDVLHKYGDLITSQFSLYANNYELFDYGKELTFGEFQELVRREALLCGDGIIVARVNHTNGLPLFLFL